MRMLHSETIKGIQYFLAGALRVAGEEDSDSAVTLGEWFGCSTIPTPGGLCEVRGRGISSLIHFLRSVLRDL